jgi:hypothetical protein
MFKLKNGPLIYFSLNLAKNPFTKKENRQYEKTTKQLFASNIEDGTKMKENTL